MTKGLIFTVVGAILLAGLAVAAGAAAAARLACEFVDRLPLTMDQQCDQLFGTGDDQCSTGVEPILAINVPDSLRAKTGKGDIVTLNRAQLTHAHTIVSVGGRTSGVGSEGIVVALMAALTESSLRMLANPSAHPDSVNYPNDGNGSDHDSLGLFQMRPQAGWGTVAELMDPTYQARAFFGGPGGPNSGSPRGLLDIPNWERLPPGEAAQAVENSAFPDRYATYEPVARQILSVLTGSSASPSEVVWPAPPETITSGFGWRDLNGEAKFHEGLDFGQDLGAPIYAAAAGRVLSAGPAGGYGNLIKIQHSIGGGTVETWYAHMADSGVLVHAGDVVQANDVIGRVGNEGHSTDPHVHFEVHVGGAAIDPQEWLRSQGASVGAGVQPAGCIGEVVPPSKNEDGTWPSEYCSVRPDPTQIAQVDSCVTPRTATLVQLLRAWGIDQEWSAHKSLACYRQGDPRESEHPLGRACDIVIGTLETCPSNMHKVEGDALAQYLATNYDTWGVLYVIWDGRIWNADRDQPGLPLAQWRAYHGATGCQAGDYAREMHYDHVHVSMR